MHEYSFNGNRILIVEDAELLRKLEERRLALVGFQVETASNGQEALDMYLNHEDWYYQAILMDIIMPIMDGREASRAIRSSDKLDSLYIPILSISADNSIDAIEMSLAAGIDVCLPKPLEFDDLFDKLTTSMQNALMFKQLQEGKAQENKPTKRYAKLWKMLIDKGITKTEFREMVGFSTVTLAKLGKGEKVSKSVLNKICNTLKCQIQDIVEE